MKYIYLMQSLENSYYKIGVSNMPNIRLKQLNTGNPSPIKLIEVYPTEFAFKIEKALHRKYAYLKIKNKEWFDFSIKEDNDFIKDCCNIEKGIKVLIEAGNEFI